MLRRSALATMQCATRRTALTTSPVFSLTVRNYQMGPFMSQERRPQLTEEQRAKVVIDQTQWPEEFKDYDPQDPYKYTPDYIEGMNTFDFWMLGIEVAFIVTFFELVFPSVYHM